MAYGDAPPCEAPPVGKPGPNLGTDNLIIHMLGTRLRGKADNPHTVYVLVVMWNKKRWTIEKRFSRFATLLKELQAHGIRKLPSLPSKTFFKRLDAEFVEKRRQALEVFIAQLGQNQDILANRTFLDFIRFEEHTISGTHDRVIRLQDFEVLSVLGKGSFGKVYRVRKKDTLQVYAMKVLKKPQVVLRKQVDHTKTERMVLQKMEHPFLVSLCFAFQTTDALYMVLDLYEGGELFKHLRKDGYFSEDRTRYYLGELILALEALHATGIVYRDLKPENVLLDKDGHLRLTDFGLSKQLIEEESTATFCGTPEYLAPEVVKHNEYSFMVDWWTVGTFCYELLCGRTPFSSGSSSGRGQLKRLYERILHDSVAFPTHVSPVARKFISALLIKDPAKRFGCHGGAAEVKAHPFFEGMDWEKLYRKEIKPPFKPMSEAVSTPDAAIRGRHRIAGTPVHSPLGALEFDNFTYNPTPVEANLLSRDSSGVQITTPHSCSRSLTQNHLTITASPTLPPQTQPPDPPTHPPHAHTSPSHASLDEVREGLLDSPQWVAGMHPRMNGANADKPSGNLGELANLDNTGTMGTLAKSPSSRAFKGVEEGERGRAPLTLPSRVQRNASGECRVSTGSGSGEDAFVTLDMATGSTLDLLSTFRLASDEGDDAPGQQPNRTNGSAPSPILGLLRRRGT